MPELKHGFDGRFAKAAVTHDLLFFVGIRELASLGSTEHAARSIFINAFLTQRTGLGSIECSDQNEALVRPGSF